MLRSRSSRRSPASAHRYGAPASRSRASSCARAWPSAPASRSAARRCTSSSTGSSRSRSRGSATSEASTRIRSTGGATTRSGSGSRSSSRRSTTTASRRSGASTSPSPRRPRRTSRLARCCAISACRSPPRAEGTNRYGQDVPHRQAEADAEAQDAGLHALQPLWSPAGRLQEVRALPNLPARDSAHQGAIPGMTKSSW